jgi:hypothetical protein
VSATAEVAAFVGRLPVLFGGVALAGVASDPDREEVVA